MGSHLGHSFESVRVHTDASAGKSAAAMGSSAYTVGRDVVFAPGRYRPSTPEGRALIADELAHVVRQGGARYDGDQLSIGPSADPLEREAEAVARTAGEARTVAVSGRTIFDSGSTAA
jgi:hypothetical protein